MARKRPSIAERLGAAIQRKLYPETDPSMIELRSFGEKGGGGKFGATSVFPAPMKTQYRKKTAAEMQSDLETFGEQYSPNQYREFERKRDRQRQRQEDAARRRKLLT